MATLSIFGLGYVGTVCAACFADLGHRVIGIDSNPLKVDLLNSGRSPVIERDLDELIAAGVSNGRLTVTQDATHAVHEADYSFICVGTPSAPNGSPQVDAVRTVCHEIGEALKTRKEGHLIVVRSTVPPGTTEDIVIPTVEAASGKRLGKHFDIVVNPEFMREGSAVSDFRTPSRTVVGASQADPADRLLALYRHLPGQQIKTSLVVAELTKYLDNVWHALKVGFANEIGSICKSLDVDSHEAMNVFLADERLNISRAYLRPGFAFGGSCLPKDVRALTYFAKAHDLDLPIIRNIMRSNQSQVERGISWILEQEKRKISFVGISFKSGTDDLRESPYLEMVERLIGKGCDIRIFDENVQLSRLIGANRNFLMNMIPHVADLLVPSIDAAIAHGEVIVVTQNETISKWAARLLRADQRVLDFTRSETLEKDSAAYDGFSW